MKIKISRYLIVLSCLIFIISGCTKNFTSINTNPNGTSHAYPEQLLAPALVNMVSANMIRNRNFNNELMQVTVNQTDADATVFRYSFPVSWSNYLYNSWYGEITNFRDIYLLANDSLTYNTSYMGISLICQSWAYSLLTDTYGDIPFSEAIQGRDSLNFTPKFDKQKDIYQGLFKNLEDANTLLKNNTNISSSNDPVYSGNVTKWRKFGNALYLRLLLRISAKSEVSADCIAKIKAIVEDPSTYPIMTSNDDAAILRWTGVGPYVSPWYTIRGQDFRSVALCSFFLSHLVDWNDPRIDLSTYATNGINRWGIATVSGEFKGVASGYVSGEGDPKGSYFYSLDQTVNGATPPNNCLQIEPLTGMIFNYAELQFILCECAMKGWITGSAATYYNNGVQASITQWIPTWTGSSQDYLINADMQWDDNATDDRKMEMIHIQKYYALFCEDLQQWFEYRRTGHPILPKGAGLSSGGIMPARMQYPAYLIGSNPGNYAEALTYQGNDAISTNVWWQKP